MKICRCKRGRGLDVTGPYPKCMTCGGYVLSEMQEKKLSTQVCTGCGAAVTMCVCHLLVDEEGTNQGEDDGTN